jgi:hypothetical protein
VQTKSWTSWATAGALLTVGLLTASPAFAATKIPGVVQAKDVPGKFSIAREPVTFTTIQALTFDGTTCTDTPQPEQGVAGAVALNFARVDTKPGAKNVSESITWYDNARDAKASLARRSTGLKAAAKCSSIAFVPPGQPTTAAVAGGTSFKAQKFPTIGDGSFAYKQAPTTGGQGSYTVTILSGKYIVQMNIFDGLTSPQLIKLGLKDLATTAKRAVQRLPHPVTLPTPAPTRALVVDPAKSGCAQQGLKSPSSPTKATITFVNKTDQILNITWIDYTGAGSSYGSVDPKGTAIQQTYAGHIWELTDQTGQCVRIATAIGPKTTVTVKG